MKVIRAVAFDMDGLLFNTEHLYDHVSTEIVGKRGRQVDPQLIRRMMGQPAQAALQLMIDHYGFDDTPEALADRDRSHFRRYSPQQTGPDAGGD